MMEGESTEMYCAGLSSSILQLPHGRYARVWLVRPLDRRILFQGEAFEVELASSTSLLEVGSPWGASGVPAQTAACCRGGLGMVF